MKERKVLKNYTLSGTVLIPDIAFTNCDFCKDYPENPIKVETKGGLKDPLFCPLCGKRLKGEKGNE